MIFRPRAMIAKAIELQFCNAGVIKISCVSLFRYLVTIHAALHPFYQSAFSQILGTPANELTRTVQFARYLGSHHLPILVVEGLKNAQLCFWKKQVGLDGLKHISVFL